MGMMPNHTTFAPRPLLLAAVLAGSILPFLLQTKALAQTSTPSQPSQPATTPAPAKPASATAPKTGTAKTATAPAPLVLKTAKQKRSYAIGSNVGKGLGNQLKSQAVDVDPALVARGLRDALSGAKPAMTEAEIRATITELTAQLQQNRAAANKEASEKNKQEGEAFLAANKSKEGVITLPSGLQYKILKAGDGKKPLATDTVQCNYRGTLVNGTEFDSSAKHGGAPATFPVNGVIKGWTEALQLMPMGSKWQLFIPSDLAYGDRGMGGSIGPGATLIFEVELVSIQEKAEAKPETMEGKPEVKQ
jgi:FKBP-type peptidyl-prolyl cis-trans isomerase